MPISIGAHPPAFRVSAGSRKNSAQSLTFALDAFSRELQRFFLDPHVSVKTVAYDMGWDYSALLRCVRGQKAFPANRLPALIEATGHIEFLNLLARELGQHVAEIPGYGSVAQLSAQEALAELVCALGSLAEAVQAQEKGEGDMREREINQAIDTAHIMLERLRALLKKEPDPHQPHQNGTEGE